MKQEILMGVATFWLTGRYHCPLGLSSHAPPVPTWTSHALPYYAYPGVPNLTVTRASILSSKGHNEHVCSSFFLLNPGSHNHTCNLGVALNINPFTVLLRSNINIKTHLWPFNLTNFILTVDPGFCTSCQMVSELFRKVQDAYIQQRELGWRGKGLRQQPSTAASHFLQSLTELTTRLERYQHIDSLLGQLGDGYGCTSCVWNETVVVCIEPGDSPSAAP